MTLAAINDTVKSPGMRLLDEVLAEGIKKEDLKDIVGTFVTKAKEGHIPSANFLLKMLGAESTPQTVIINNFENDVSVRPATVIDRPREHTALEQVTVYLTAAGPSSPTAIAGGLGIDEETVIRVLDDNPSRFAVTGSKYRLERA